MVLEGNTALTGGGTVLAFVACNAADSTLVFFFSAYNCLHCHALLWHNTFSRPVSELQVRLLYHFWCP